MRTARVARLLALAAPLLLAACGGSDAPAPGGGGGGGGGSPALGGGKTLGRKMPAFTPSGMREDLGKWKELKSAVRYAKKVEEQDVAKKAFADFLAEFPSRWEGTTVPEPEAYYYAVILQECDKFSRAAEQAQRYLDVAPDDSVNYLNAKTLRITCLAQAGEIDAAEREMNEARDTVYKNRDGDLRQVAETIANTMVLAGRVDLAAEKFRDLAEANFDVETAVQAVDCYLRLGKVDDARRLAERMTGLVKDGPKGERAKTLVAQVALIGKPAPGFGEAKWWKGDGGPLTADSFAGKVTVVFTWNMKSQWNSFFFDRLNLLVKDLADQPFQVSGISRLARYDATLGGTKADMTDEEELSRYDMWKQQYDVTYPLAVDAYGSDGLMDAWAGHVVPSYIVVGKDGIVCYVRTGKEEVHFKALKEEIEKALKK